MCLAVGSTSAAWKYLPSIVSDMDLSSRQGHFLDSNVGQGLFVHKVTVGAGHEGQHDSVPDTAFDLVSLAVADIEAEAGTGLGLGDLVVVLDDIHWSFLHSAYSQEVKDTRLAVEEAVVASPPENWKAVNSLSACEPDSWELEEARLMNSWSASDQGVGQHRRCSRRLPLARNSKHVRIDWDGVHQNVLARSPPYCQLIMAVPTSPGLSDPSGLC